MTNYLCPVCGYLHAGDIDFCFCPVCMASARIFIHDTNADNFGRWDLNSRPIIRSMAEMGSYHQEGRVTARTFLGMDDLIFLPAQVNNFPLGHEVEIDSRVVLGKRARQPVFLQTPILNAAMSCGPLSKEASMALALGSFLAGTIVHTGDGGMGDEEMALTNRVTVQFPTDRFGVSEESLRGADMVEIKISQGVKFGIGGKVRRGKVIAEIAAVSRLGQGKMPQSPAMRQDIKSAKDLSKKILELRRLLDGKPISLKLAGGHLQNDLEAIFSQDCIPDVLVIDGGEGCLDTVSVTVGEHVGLPLIYSLPRVGDFLDLTGLRERVTLIAAGGIRHSGDIAKAIALGADGVYMSGALKIALGPSSLSVAQGGQSLSEGLDIHDGGMRVANFISAATEEVKAIARLCGKRSIHDLNRDDLVSLDSELSRITGVSMA
ncbi:glutamate synthase-related protein [Desulfotalea psychrophila]|uniref:Related to glutamate synthase, large subunit n=1 Tax=Desulfotalea psychrophila (strain LSv54 / DSM 12343) TaxID=177439 RepID=Q6AQZ0_DESPS|nr:glutamate synthase-related protein [Desulfotalea psychrophila]CAG35234.1 related to glutamate synthase, large subunit [Desulfotalea psychrophila LSv54]